VGVRVPPPTRTSGGLEPFRVIVDVMSKGDAPTDIEITPPGTGRLTVASLDINNPLPAKAMIVLPCMDCRIDRLAVLGLSLGDAQVLRNAGGRVSEDVLRSLAVATHVIGVRSLVIMQHTRCGMEGATNEDLSARTGAQMDFLPIEDHSASIQADIEQVVAQPFLGLLESVKGCLYDLASGSVETIATWDRQTSGI
jgi:carbonic anhydrase